MPSSKPDRKRFTLFGFKDDDDEPSKFDEGENTDGSLAEPLLPSQDSPSVDVITQTSPLTEADESIDDKEAQKNSLISPKRVKELVPEGIIPEFEKPQSLAQFFLLTIAFSLPGIMYILVFSQIDLGLKTYYYLARRYADFALPAFVSTVSFLLLLQILDINYWKSNFARLTAYLLVVAGLMFSILAWVDQHPYGPLTLTCAVILPLWIVVVKWVFFRDTNPIQYVKYIGAPLFLNSILSAILFVTWALIDPENRWNDVTRVTDAKGSGCKPDFTDFPGCRSNNTATPDDVCFHFNTTEDKFIFPTGCNKSCVDIYDSCPNTFIVWVGPILVGLGYFFLSNFCSFLVKHNLTSQRGLANFMKLWVVLLLATWVTSSLVGAGAGVSAVLTTLTFALFIASYVLLSVTYSKEENDEEINQLLNSIRSKYGTYVDYFRGLLILLASPLAFAYLGLSFLKQMVRRMGCFPGSKSFTEASEEEKNDWVTAGARRQINMFQSWPLTKVLRYAVYWGILFISVQVLFSEFTLLLLTWLIETTSSMNWIVVSGIMFGVGLIMFLLPPVPGVPVYLAIGIVIVATGREALGLIGSIVYGIGLSLALKLTACAVQQKGIGQPLSKYVIIRQMVGINTELIRGTKLILSTPGLNIAKVSILVGGPDWPTSVLCGILRLDLIPILIGTIPVVLVIIPTLLTASFTYMGSLKLQDGNYEFPWAKALASVAAMCTAGVQIGSFLIFTNYLDETLRTRKEEIEAMPYDEEVKKLDDKAQEKTLVFDKESEWSLLPRWVKALLSLSVGTMVLSCLLVNALSKSCFVEYKITSTITEDLDGNALNLIKPLGWAALGLFGFSVVLLKMFSMWVMNSVTNNPPLTDSSLVSDYVSLAEAQAKD